MSIAVGGTTLLRAQDKAADTKMEKQETAPVDLLTNFTDAGFVKAVSTANTDEIKAGESALKNSSNDDVKMLAQHMVDDHTKAETELKALADQKGWTVHEMVDEKHKMAMDQMEKLTGAEFDRSYAVAQVKDHEDTVALFKVAAEKASDADLKGWVNGTLPTLESHLKMARDVESKTMANPAMK